MDNVNREQLYAEQVEQVYSNQFVALTAGLINAVILSSVLWSEVAHSQLATWLTLIILLSAIRFLHLHTYNSSSTHLSHAQKWARHHVIGLSASGLAWGAAAILIFPETSLPHQTFVAFILGGMVVGAAATSSALKYFFCAYSIPALSPLIIRFFMLSDTISVAMGAMLLVFFCCCLVISRQIRTSLTRSLKLKQEKEGEIQIRKKAQEELFRYQENLEKTIADSTVELQKRNAELTEQTRSRKKAEHEMRHTNALLNSLIDSIPELIFYKDHESTYLGCNTAFTEFAGRSKDAIVGYSDFDFFDRDLAEFFRGKDREMLQMGKPKRNEEWVPYPDGRRVLLDTLKTPYFDPNGKVIGLIGISRDITEHKNIENALRESQKLHTEAQEIAHIGHWILDLTTNELVWSDELYRIFGIDKEKYGASYEAFLDLVHPEDREYVDTAYSDSVKNKTPYDIGHRIIFGDGRIKYLHERGRTEYDDTGKPLRSLGTCQDITFLKEIESQKEKMAVQLQHAEKMEAVGALAGGIAHDFNNLLNVISGYSEFLMLDTPEGSKQYQDILEINNAGKRAAELVRHLLTFSSGDDLDRQSIKLSPIVKETLKFLRSTLPTTIKITQDLDDCGPVVANSTQIHQIIMNLCTNAFHAMGDQKGVLEVRLKEVDVDHDQASQMDNLSEGRYVCLTVSDTGRGIDEVTVNRIFEPYFSTKDKAEGTGLGLSSVHGILKSCGGAITVASELDKGTTFTLFFPVADTELTSQPATQGAKELPVLHGRILLVDDVDINVQLGTYICERLGCSVRGFTSSIEALSLFRDVPEEFDLIITDQTMPDLTGEELAKEILKIRPDIPIIMVTGHSSIVDEQQAKDAGIREFLMKPLEINSLAEAMSRSLS